MSGLSSLLIGTAWAADAAGAMSPPTTAGSALVRFLPLFLIFAVFYFLLIRPQQKGIDAQKAMLAALKKGDEIVTGGGVIGKVVSFDGDDRVVVEIAEGVRVKIVRSTVSSVNNPDAPKPANTNK